MQASHFLETAYAHLPHRTPFLFVDRAEVSADSLSVRAWYTFSDDESFFQGHFPNDPVVPGVILLECMAQAANVLLSHRAGHMIQSFLINVDGASFNLLVRPHQTFVTDIRFSRDSGPDSSARPRCMVEFRASGTVDARRCSRARITIYKVN